MPHPRFRQITKPSAEFRFIPQLNTNHHYTYIYIYIYIYICNYVFTVYIYIILNILNIISPEPPHSLHFSKTCPFTILTPDVDMTINQQQLPPFPDVWVFSRFRRFGARLATLQKWGVGTRSKVFRWLHVDDHVLQCVGKPAMVKLKCWNFITSSWKMGK